MRFIDIDMQEIKQYFPNLELINGTIQGEMAFSAKYVKNKRSQWVIESCNGNHEKKCVTGNYQIKITYNQKGELKVFEISGKITTLANQLRILTQDLHINSDESCCLGFISNPKLNAKEFILNKVYPFFVWQAYYEKFKKVPPSGEYSHGIKAREEFINDVKKAGRNDICFCGTGKKHKKCCQLLLSQP